MHLPKPGMSEEDSVPAGPKGTRQAKSLFRGNAWRISAGLSGMAVLNTVVIAANFFLMFRYLGVEQFGYYRSFLSVITFSGLFHAGLVDGYFLHWLMNRRIPRMPELLGVVVLTCLLGMALFAFDYPAGNAWMVLGYILAANVAAFLHNALVKRGIFHSHLLVILFSQLVFTAYLLLRRDASSLDGMILLGLVVNVLTTLVLLGYTLAKKVLVSGLRPWPSAARTWRCWTWGFPVLISGLYFVAFFNLDKVWLGTRFPPAQFGHYAFASSLISVGFSVLGAPVNLVLSRMAGKPADALRSNYHNLFTGILLAGMLLALLLPVVFQWITQWLPAYQPAGAFVSGWMWVLSPLLIMQLLVSNLYKRFRWQVLYLGIVVFSFALLIGFLNLVPALNGGLGWVPFGFAQLLLLTLFILDALIARREPVFRKGYLWRIGALILYNIVMLLQADVI